jgi:hypothetical protein
MKHDRTEKRYINVIKNELVLHTGMGILRS